MLSLSLVRLAGPNVTVWRKLEVFSVQNLNVYALQTLP
jgi:hypothetical protein